MYNSNMTNLEIARLLKNVAVAYSIKDEVKHRFQIIAYQKAADVVEHASVELKDLYKEGKLEKLPAIGSSIISHLQEIFEKGRVRHFEKVISGIPKAVFPLLDIPTFGPKKAYKIVKSFKLNNPDTVAVDVERLAKQGKISKLPSFGDKSEKDILRAIQEFNLGTTKTARMILPYAFENANKLISYLKQSKEVVEAYPLGSLRRMASTVGDIDIAVASDNAGAVIEHFVRYPHTERVLERGKVTASILISGGRHVDLMVQKPDRFGSLLQHFTGSKHHNVALREYALKKGWSLSEYGIKKAIASGKWQTKEFDSEEKFYKALGMDWIPPEIRENQGEIELAVKRRLPKLVELDDIKGDLHAHSNFRIEPSHDLGNNSMEEMIKKAVSLEYEYLGFSEHNPSITNHTKTQVYSILSRRKEKIEQIKRSTKNIHIINLLEVDILADGNVSIDDKALKLIDSAIVSIHSSFSMDVDRMTKRILKGLSHPKAKIFAHPTGRLLNERPGYNVDWDKLFDFASKNKKALEINAWPTRLDLPDMLVKQAKDCGVRFIINTDSHADWQMDNILYGVAVARRGWCTKNDILNTQPYEKIFSWLINC